MISLALLLPLSTFVQAQCEVGVVCLGNNDLSHYLNIIARRE